MRSVLIVAGALVVVPAFWPAGAAQQQRLYVTVADEQGRPISGLAADDFFLRIDDTPQEIVSVRPATAPVSAILLTDRLGLVADFRATDVQRALRRWVDRLRATAPDSRIALTSFDGFVVRLEPFDAAPAALDRALGRLTGVAREAPLVDALDDACRMMAGAPTDRRVILLVFAAYRPDQGNPRPDVAGRSCRVSGASLWVLEARSPDGRNYPNPAREAVVDQVSRASGGLHELVTTAERLEALAGIMADLVGGQYEVTYGPGGAAPRAP